MRRPVRLLALISGVALVVGLTAPADAMTNPTDQLRTQVSFPSRTVTDAAGNTLLADSHGRAVQLRGANLGKEDDVTEKDVADLAAAGLTLLRIPIQWSRVEPTQGTYDTAYVQHLEDALGWAHEYGLMVIVDWHQDVFGPAFPGFDGAPEWATRTDGIEFEPIPGNWFYNYFHPAVQAAFDHLWNDADLRAAQVAAWTYVAAQLKGAPALLGYDLFNEPMAGNITLEDTANLSVLAGKALEFESGELADMYRRVIAGIRTVDTHSWLWVEPTVLVGEGLPTRLPKFDDPRSGADRIGYAPHAYSTSVEDGDDWDPASGFVTSFEGAITTYPRKNHLPVIVGEWGPGAAGPNHPGNVQLVQQQVTSFARFASGWALWYACRGDNDTRYCIFSDDDGHLDPARAGAWRPYPLALAGTTVAEVATPKRYTLVYSPRTSRAGTQIVVPSRFGDRISVRLSDGARPPQGVTTVVSAPTRTGARTVTVTGPVRKHPTWTLTITRR